MTDKKLIAHFCGASALFLGLLALFVFAVDPFFHYHEPWFGLKPYLSAHQYQVPGVIENMEYDSVLCGSSVVMSMNTDTIDESLDCTTVKLVGNSASAPYLMNCLELAFEQQELRYVFYGLDIFSLYVPDGGSFEKDVEHLSNDNPFDDIKYLWNGTIIGENAFNMIRMSRHDYTWGMGYQFVDDQGTGVEQVFSSYDYEKAEMTPMMPENHMEDVVSANIDNLVSCIEAHPETEFCFFMPAYSQLYWVRAYIQGEFDTYLYTMESCFSRLLTYDNVTIYSSNFNNLWVTSNFSLYVDLIHGGYPITEMMTYEICNDGNQITLENYQDEIAKLRDGFYRFYNRLQSEGPDFLYWGPVE